jgi:hypothetical protein
MQQTGKGSSTQTTGQERQTLTISRMKELKTRHTNTGLWKERELGAMHVLLKKKKRHKNKIQVFKMQHWAVSQPLFQGISHQTAFLRTNLY